MRASRGIQLVVFNQPWTESPLVLLLSFLSGPNPFLPQTLQPSRLATYIRVCFAKILQETCSSGHSRLIRAVIVSFSPSTRQFHRPFPFPVFVSMLTFDPQKRSTCALQMMMTLSHTKPKLCCVHAPPRPPSRKHGCIFPYLRKNSPVTSLPP